MTLTPLSEALIAAARRLRAETARLTFGAPVTHVYNPLYYAWAPHEAYLRKFGASPKRIIFLGINPGPFGMVQTGVPFGEVAAVRDWLRINGPVRKPRPEHPRRPVTGLACPRSEVSGRNRTPDKLPAPEKTALFAPCDRHLRAVIAALQPEWLIAIGDFAATRAEQVFRNSPLKLGRILHPSPASPAANRNWQALATRQLELLGVWQ